MFNKTDSFYDNKPEPQKSCLLALRSIILAQDADITESIKWGMPTFSYRKRMFCYLWTDKKTGEPYILMADGNHLHHPQLEEGNRARMKIFWVSPDDDLPIETIQTILNDGLSLYKNGVIMVK